MRKKNNLFNSIKNLISVITYLFECFAQEYQIL